MFEHRLHLSKIGHTFLNGVSLSDLIWTYVVTGAYCLVQGRVWRFYQRWKFSCDPLSSVVNLTTEVGNHMWIVSVCCQQWSVWPPLREELRRYVKQRCTICVVHGNLPLQHPAKGKRLYRLYIPCYHPTKHSADAFLSPTIPLPIHAAAVPLWHISALNDAFGRFSPGLAYFALHLFRTGWNWFKYM